MTLTFDEVVRPEAEARARQVEADVEDTLRRTLPLGLGWTRRHPRVLALVMRLRPGLAPRLEMWTEYGGRVRTRVRTSARERRP